MCPNNENPGFGDELFLGPFALPEGAAQGLEDAVRSAVVAGIVGALAAAPADAALSVDDPPQEPGAPGLSVDTYTDRLRLGLNATGGGFFTFVKAGIHADLEVEVVLKRT